MCKCDIFLVLAGFEIPLNTKYLRFNFMETKDCRNGNNLALI